MPGGGTWKEVAKSRTRERHAFKKAGRFSNGGQHPTLQGRQAAAWQTGKGLQRKSESPLCMEKHAQVWRIAKREIVELLSLGKAEFSCREPVIYIYSQQVYLSLPPHTY